ncbi:MAG: AN1-type zinc finger domain-containing protein [Candidatus Hodarchaeota archaeon]
MTNCYYCEIEIRDLPYRCKFCGLIFCNKHRLPEYHNCPFDLRKKGKYIDALGKTRLLYQDVLEHISKELTVAQIYDYVTSKSMTKSEAIELLNYIIENSENSETRKISILAFKVLELKSEKAFSVLESCLLSEEDPDVKKTTAETIAYNFPKKSKNLLNWINKHDEGLKSRK